MNKKEPTTNDQTSAPPPAQPPLPADEYRPLPFPVVAIGASAGGLEALKQFLAAMPGDSGLAFVVIQHLDPDKLSLMAEILARSTAMAVSQAVHGDRIAPNHLYVAPPGKRLLLRQGELLLDPLPKDRAQISHAVDEFLRSLAQEQGDRAIAIILSGTGADGALGVKAIKEAGGLAMAQEPAEAGYDGMPLAAIATGLVDFVLPVAAMAAELLQYVRHAYFAGQEQTLPLSSAELEAQLTEIIDLLSRRRGIDFGGYKRGTLFRRTERRMNILHLQDIRAYGERLRRDDQEVAALAKDLLIVVTGFFRDPEAFDLLRAKVIAPLCQQVAPEVPVRVWVAGAATGEEAYSLAMLIIEELERCHQEGGSAQIFATDVDKAALQQARSGRFPAAIAADLSQERLDRFFDREEGGYRVKKQVREMITFSEQDLIKDTPFSRIDLISCRNLLIYLTVETQRRILALFHFALRPGGMLFLGNAESVGQADDLFRPVDKKWRIYRKIDAVRVPMVAFPLTQKVGKLHAATSDQKKTINLRALGENELLRHCSPCGVIITPAFDIVQFLGNTNLFLTLPPGDPTTNLLAMAPMVMRTPLRAMLQDLIGRKHLPSTLLLRLPDHEGRPYRHIQVGARRIEAPGVEQELFLVTFADLPPECELCLPAPADAKEGYVAHELVIKQLEEELRQSRESLESTIEQMEAANEELKANNEEAMSMNEEFQSTNEELETSKEELQSMNEELATVNAELHDKVAELEVANNDLDNLLASSEVAFLFLDEQFRIKRFTPAIHKLFRLIPSDLGRPLEDFGATMAEFTLLADAKQVMHELRPMEKEIPVAGGRWYLQRVLPYRTKDNHIQGVLITFLDITLLKEKTAEAFRQTEILKVLNDTLPLRVAYVDGNERHIFANHDYKQEFHPQPGELMGLTLLEVLGPTFHEAAAPFIGKALAGERAQFEKTLFFEGKGWRDILCAFAPHQPDHGPMAGFFIMIQDMTELRQGEANKAQLSAIVESSHDAIISRLADGTIQSWNQGAVQLFGYQPQEMIGHKIDCLFPAQQADGFGDHELLCRGLGAGHAEPACQTKDGRGLTVLLTQSPILGPEGQATAVSVVMSDISARKAQEERIRAANRDLEAMVGQRTLALQEHMAQLRRLAQELTQTEQRERQRLATVLHDDLQQLLVAAGLRLERLANTEGSGDRRQAIAQIETLLTQAVTATRSLATDLRPPVLNSGNLVKSLQWLAEWLWKRFDFSLKFTIPEEVPQDTLPDAHIVFLFETARELCFNIVKHAHVKEGRMTLRLLDRDRLCLTIADEGVGVDLERQARYVAGEDGGLGLGAIRDRLSLIGGELRINSAAGQGFTVEIILPCAATAAPQPHPAAQRRGEPGRTTTAELATGRKIRVMLVDDHTVVRDGLKMILHDEADIDVIGEAGDGEKAIKLAGKLLPDVIIMDVNMPKVTGIEATRRIKEAHPEIGIIALSINDDPGTTKAMLEAGACAYLNKSGSAEDVCGVIRNCVPGLRAAMALGANGPEREEEEKET